MSTIDWPERLIPQTCSLRLRKAGGLFTSPFNGTTQAMDYLSERWILSVQLAQLQQRDPRGVGSFLNYMSGGINRVRGWHFGRRGQMAGSLAGTPLLSTAALFGAMSISITGARNRNLWPGGGFEIDSNADGIADGWATYTTGSTGGVAYSRSAGPLYAGASGAYQSVLANALNGRIGFTRNWPVTAGTAYSLSIDQTASPGVTVYVSINWLASGGGYISESTASALSAAGRRSVSGVAPVGAVSAQCYLFIESASSGACLFNLDQAMFEVGAVPTAWPGPPTVKADDMMRLANGQLVEVLTDVSADDAGAMTIPITSHIRSTVAGGTALQLSRPYAEFILPSMEAGAVYAPGRIEGAAADFVEVWD